MSYSQKQGSSGNSGGAPSNQASQQAAKALAGIQQQMQNLVHGQNALPQSSQAGLNAFLTQQHYEMLKQQQQQLLLSNPQLQQRFQQQMQQNKDRGEPLALTRTPAAADLLNKTYQQHHQQQSNGNNATTPSLASVNQFQQQMQAANLMQQLHAYQLQFQQQQQQQQQQQHHQQPQQTHHQQQPSHQLQQKSHAQSTLASASSMQSSKQQLNQQIQQSQYSQKYIPTAAHSKSSLGGVGIPPPPTALANQLKPPNLPPSTQITPIPSPQHAALNNNLSTKGSSSSSSKQVSPSISLLPAKQPPVSLPNAPVAAHLHHHLQNKVPPISIPNQYNNPSGNKGPLVSAIPPPFPSHYQKMSSQSQSQLQPMQQNLSAANSFAAAAIHEQQEPKLQTSAVPLTKQQHQQQEQQQQHHHQPPPPTSSSNIAAIASSPAKAPIASQANQKQVAPLIPLLPPAKETTDDALKATPSPPVAAQVAPLAVAILPSHVPDTKLNTPEPAPPTKNTIESGTNSSVEASPARPANEPKSPSPLHPEAKNGASVDEAVSDRVAEEALPATTKIPTPEAPVQALPAVITSDPAKDDKPDDNKDITDAFSKSTDKMDIQPLTADDYKKSSTLITGAQHDTSDDKSKPSVEEESPASDLSSTEVNKSNDTSNNTSSSSDEQQSSVLIQPEKPEDESRPEKQEDNIELPPIDKAENVTKKPEEEVLEKQDKHEKIKTVEKSEKPATEDEKDDKKQVDKPEKEKSEKTIAKANQSEKPPTKSKTPRQSKSVAAAAILAEASGQTAEKKKEPSVVKTKVEKEDIHSPALSLAKTEKTDRKKSQIKTKKSKALPITPSTPSDRKSQRHRLKTILYQSPLPELAFITKLSASEASNSPKPHMSNEDKLIVFYKNEYMAVRNAEGSFFLCQTLQNVYRSSPRITIRWLSEDKKDNSVFTPDFYDHTDIECVLTTVDLKKIEKGHLRLPEAEKVRIENILKKAIDVEKGIVPRPDVTEENPDGLDISLYKDESQIEKKSSLNAMGGSIPRKRGRSARIRSQSKNKSPTKKKKLVLVKKKKRNNYDGSDSNTTDEESEEEDDDDDDSDIDMEYKPTSSRKKSAQSSSTQSTKSLRAQRSPLARARAASPLTPTTSRSKSSVPEKTETPAPASSVNSRNDRAIKRRAVEGTNTTPEITTKKSTAVTAIKAAKGVEKISSIASSTSKTEESVGDESPKAVNKATVVTATSTKKIRTGAPTTSLASTPSTSGTRPTRSRK